jgi:hypothetical protein
MSPYEESWPGALDAATSAPEARSLDGDATHEWATEHRGVASPWEFCRRCGVVRRSDRMHRPCTGRTPPISGRAHRCNGGRP